MDSLSVMLGISPLIIISMMYLSSLDRLDSAMQQGVVMEW